MMSDYHQGDKQQTRLVNTAVVYAIKVIQCCLGDGD